MNRRLPALSRTKISICIALLSLGTPSISTAQPAPAAISAFDAYTSRVESRLARQHQSPAAFLSLNAPQPDSSKRLRAGELIIEQLTPAASDNVSGAMLHHWRGTAFVPGAKASDLQHLLSDFSSYPQHFSPEVLRAGVTHRDGDRMQAWMRVRQQHVLTVVMDTAYDVTFGQLDAQHRYSISRSTRITEIASPGTPSEHPLSPGDEHGFLWRLNTYWTWEERDGGLYLQIESVSLTRSIPRGLAWAVRPYIESVPRESLEFTLRAAQNALRSPLSH